MGNYKVRSFRSFIWMDTDSDWQICKKNSRRQQNVEQVGNWMRSP